MRIRLIASVLVSMCGSAQAGPVDQSVRPLSRAADDSQVSRSAVSLVSVVAPQNSLRPALRPAVTPKPETLINAATQSGFNEWIRGFRTRALRQGISADIFDRAFANVQYEADVIRRDRNQSEFTKTIWDYLDSAASDTRVNNGKAALRKHGSLLDRIEAQYGVDKDVIVAIWGLESAYGTFRGSNPVIGSLATLAYDARRSDFFEEQLVEALKILHSGDVRLANFKGSWAGAMGHTQFIPTSYQSLAVDFDGDGKRDIWSDDPADALASTANYLAKNGWVKGMPWGVEVRIPQGFDYTLANRDILRMPSDWAKMGIVDLDGNAVPDHGSASVLLPAGAKGAAFLIFKNFDVIETYNTADAYVIGVGHLSDRITGAGPIRSDWPREDRALSFAERKEMQRLLTAKGFDTKKIDGKIGPLTINAVRAFQTSIGDVPDGYASLNILKKLR
ncbi:lytic murein transglycosylase [Marivita geojedonensis]|uniref:Murein transglycosylase n=1 Tax=Marivita geojedonensis TaxID=1123756 RepID=A0A1X4NLF3_9RHOB|nr:lytic murein transglycosylase [Marivita geojedonensis]OSQ51074.1 murein transglycosylase [Marivita geojedonensis]PRY79915.1 membrane-bound lytic murein transglycosylase B [Marivita geojedonensis]